MVTVETATPNFLLDSRNEFVYSFPKSVTALYRLEATMKVFDLNFYRSRAFLICASL